MKIVQLSYFVEVVKTNNITKAAENLYVSQPAISKAIKELEEEFKTSLFVRYNNQLALTDEGYLLYSLAIPILRNIEIAKEKMNMFVNKSRSLKIGIPPMIGNLTISPIIKKYSIEHPDVDIQISELASEANRKAVLNGDITMCLTVLAEGQPIDDGLVCEELLNTELLFTVANTTHIKNKKSISYEEINKFPLILMKEDCLQSYLINKEFVKRNMVPNVKIRSNQMMTIRELLINNSLGAFIFSHILVNEDKLIGIPLEDPVKIRIVAAYRKNEKLDPVYVQFMGYCKSKLKA